MSKLLIIDGNAMLFRAYYATKYGRMMTTSNGIPTNAVYGFITMLNKAVELIQPEYMLVAWDAGKPTFRHQKYADYKGTRKQLDEELIVQFPIIREYLDACGIVRYEQEGIEADDIIGSMSKKYSDIETIILSSDRDLLQLIDDSTRVLLMKKGITEMQMVDEKELKNSFHVSPKQIIELKGLMGDTADNIPGVKGIGEKTAVSLLESYDTVENVYAHIDEIKGKLKEKLIADKDKAYLSLFLATIITDADLHIELEQCRFALNAEGCNQFLRKYEMNSLLIKEEKKEEKKQGHFQKVTKISEAMLNENTLLLLDADLEEVNARTYFGLTWVNQSQSEYIALEDLLKDQKALDFLAGDTPKMVYDAKNFYHFAYLNHFTINALTFDVMIAAFLIDGTLTSLEALCQKYAIQVPSQEDIYGKMGKPKLTDETERLERMKQLGFGLYALIDSLKTSLHEKECDQLFEVIEMPLAQVLFEMEKNGVACSKDTLDEIAQKNQKRIDELSAAIYEIAGHEFNINSPKQLGIVLFDELGLKAGKKRSTAVDVLEKLDHPIIPLLMEQRKLQKLNSTYAIGLVRHIQKDGKIHTTFNQCLTTTGRLSSSDPNLQNISVRDEDGKEIRKAFSASEGCILLSADYSQIELRMLAHMANVKEMIEAFNTGIDIHTQTAMNVFHVGHDEVTPLMRRQAKAVNFGIVYGISDFGLSEQLDISRNQAKDFIDRYFESYPNIRVFMDETVQYCQEHGYVKTLFNRRREIPEIHDKNYMVREFGKRAAMNAPIQGSSADLIKVAMNNVYQAMKKANCRSKMILQIHDELIFDVVKEEEEMMKELVRTEMENAMKLSVPLSASVSVGNNWYEAK